MKIPEAKIILPISDEEHAYRLPPSSCRSGDRMCWQDVSAGRSHWHLTEELAGGWPACWTAKKRSWRYLTLRGNLRMNHGTRMGKKREAAGIVGLS